MLTRCCTTLLGATERPWWQMEMEMEIWDGKCYVPGKLFLSVFFCCAQTILGKCQFYANVLIGPLQVFLSAEENPSWKKGLK